MATEKAIITIYADSELATDLKIQAAKKRTSVSRLAAEYLHLCLYKEKLRDIQKAQQAHRGTPDQVDGISIT